MRRIRTLGHNVCPYCCQPALKAFTRGAYGTVLWTECTSCKVEWKLREKDESKHGLGDTELVGTSRLTKDKGAAEKPQGEGSDKASGSEGAGEGWTEEKARRLRKLLDDYYKDKAERERR